MWLCDYINDLGYEFRRMKPYIIGRNMRENQFLTATECLSVISNWISVDDYYEVGDKEAVCPHYGRLRKVVYQDSTYLIEMEYPRPPNVDFSAMANEPVKLLTVPEFLNGGTAIMLLRLNVF